MNLRPAWSTWGYPGLYNETLTLSQKGQGWKDWACKSSGCFSRGSGVVPSAYMPAHTRVQEIYHPLLASEATACTFRQNIKYRHKKKNIHIKNFEEIWLEEIMKEERGIRRNSFILVSEKIQFFYKPQPSKRYRFLLLKISVSHPYLCIWVFRPQCEILHCFFVKHSW